ncbi:MAG: Na(+)/H(+) antiporter subunit D [Acidobacteriota bacterium]
MADFLATLPPGLLLIGGGLLLALLRGRIQRWALVILPLLSAWHLLSFLPEGTTVAYEIFGYELMPVRVDRLSLVWGYVFHLAAFVSALYAFHVEDTLQHVSGLIYAGAAIGAVFSGDLVTLFVYWELTALSSVFLIWARRRERAHHAGMRYLVAQVGSGVLLLAGALYHFGDSGSLAFGALNLDTLGGLLIFLAFGIKAAFPLLHNWLQDAYPEATVTGTVFLSAFTTKLAIYALARGFAGTEILIPIGAAMTAFPIFFAVIENDLRRVLAYSLNNQLGFMVVGIGLGTELSLNGTAAHAFVHILYKALLFMSMGAVLNYAGTAKGSELGGLYKKMPWTTAFCIVGAASISAFPLFSGFVAKALILSEAAYQHRTVVYLILLFASAGVFHHSGIKIPFFAFFHHDTGKWKKFAPEKRDFAGEAPKNMLWAMALTALPCLAIGMFPHKLLYPLLPFPVTYEPYTMAHVITQIQLLMFSALAFTVLNRIGAYPPELRSTVLDTDWFYRKPGRALAEWLHRHGATVDRALRSAFVGGLHRLLERSGQALGPTGWLGGIWTTRTMVLWATLLLAACLILYYV